MGASNENVGVCARVAEISESGLSVVINRGSKHGVQMGQRFLVYGLSETEIRDPETGESLGALEIVRGTGIVIHVQEKMATLRSDQKRSVEKRRIVRRNPFTFGTEEEIETPPEGTIPFHGSGIGDYVKPI